MKFIVLVYTNGRTVQDIVFTSQPVNPIDFHKERFKAKATFLYTGIIRCALSSSLRCYPSFLILPISFMWGIAGKIGFLSHVFG